VGPLTTRCGTSSRCGRRRRLADMEGSCEYPEKDAQTLQTCYSIFVGVVRGGKLHKD